MLEYWFILFTLIILAVTLVTGQSITYVKQLPTSKSVLTTLKPDHPRLFLTADKINALKIHLERNELVQQLVAAFMVEAESILVQPPVEYKLKGPWLLSQSRLCLKRVSTLALAYFLWRKPQYVERVEQELLAAAAFPDWNPSHFLDVAEMTNAFGIGYDWLFHELSDSTKVKIRTALIEKGLKPSLDPKFRWWAKVEHNWNQVCNGGLAVGALAIADEEPELARQILVDAVQNITFALKSYGPDGGWGEGPGYWSYATQYTVFMLDALESALGTDFGLSDAPGFERTGLFPIYNTGPSGLTFNYADAGAGSGPMFPFFWLGQKFQLKLCLEEQNRRLVHSLARGNAPQPWDLIWFQSVRGQPKLSPNAYYSGIEVLFFRSDWVDEEAFYIGIKGGDNRTNHAHLDIGSFVLDALGERWAEDLGGDDYKLPGYWEKKEGGQRWQYFRLNNFSHNTLTLNNDLQRVNARAPIIKHKLTDKQPSGIIDLTEAYLPSAKKVLRGVKFIDKNCILIQDEISWDKKSEKQWTWNWLTRADVELKGRTAILHRNNKSLLLSILSPKKVRFDTLSAHREPPEDPNTGYQRLIIQGNEASRKTRIAVMISNEKQMARLRPLAKW